MAYRGRGARRRSRGQTKNNANDFEMKVEPQETPIAYIKQEENPVNSLIVANEPAEPLEGGVKRALDDQTDDTGEDVSMENNGEAANMETDEDGSTLRPRKKRKVRQGPPIPKTPVQVLCELNKMVEFNVESESGPPHAPTFIMTVRVDGVEFKSDGPSKQKAKHNAAEVALKSLYKDGIPSVEKSEKIGESDFTSDMVEGFASPFAQDTFSPSKIKDPSTLPPITDKNPVQMLNELHQKPIFIIVQERDIRGDSDFIYKVIIDGKEFIGNGKSKKIAKARSAETALYEMHGIRTMSAIRGNSISNQDDKYLPLDIADQLSLIVNQKFNELTQSLQEPLRRKVLAGFVMASGPEDNRRYTVVSLGTGTKCINGEYISDQGLALNDCHGEIIARRALLRYLYSQLEQCIQGIDSCFVKKESGMFGLKEDVCVHLYINTAPCGDARIFSPHEAPDTREDRHSKRKNRGVLRTKIEAGEGTIPVKADQPIQTWDGIIRGEKLLTMSCSDKISRWNVTGIQGSLLSLYVEPIYLSSIVLGSLFNIDHMSRAMHGRLGQIESLPSPFRAICPQMSGVSNPEPRVPGKSPNTSSNWSLGDFNLELVNATTGKCDESTPSRLSKQAMYSRFMLLWKSQNSNPLPASYHDAKQEATLFNEAKKIAMEAFTTQNLGKWVEKPLEQDLFTS